MFGIVADEWTEASDLILKVVENESLRSQLKEKQKVLKTVEGVSHLGHWKVDIPSSKVFWSDEVYRIYGVEKKTFTPMLETFWGQCAPAEQVKIKKIWQEALKKGKSFKFKISLTSFDNHPCCVMIAGEGTFDAEKSLTGLFGIIQKITPLVHKEITLETPQRRYELAMKGSRAAIYDWNIRENTLFLSAQFRKKLGLKTKDFALTFENLKSRIHPEDRQNVEEALENHFFGESSYEVDYRLRCDQGSYIWVHSRGQLIWSDEGDPLRMVGSVVNITDRKRTELFLEDAYRLSTLDALTSQERIEKILEKACHHYALEFAGIYTLHADQLVPLYSMSKDPQILATHFYRSQGQIVHEGLKLKTCFTHDLELDHKKEGILLLASLETEVPPNRMGPSTLEMIAHRFATELRRAKQEIEHQEYSETIKISNQKLEEFANIVAHDLREPLRGINIYSAFLLDLLRKYQFC